MSNWERLTLKLGVSRPMLEKFKDANPNTAKIRALNYWRNGKCKQKNWKGKPRFPSTWRFLLDCVEKIQEDGCAVAEQLKELASKDKRLTIMV